MTRFRATMWPEEKRASQPKRMWLCCSGNSQNQWCDHRSAAELCKARREMGVIRNREKEMWVTHGGDSKGKGREHFQSNTPSKICILTSSDLSGRERIFRFR